jgi:hypothetical protein
VCVCISGWHACLSESAHMRGYVCVCFFFSVYVCMCGYMCVCVYVWIFVVFLFLCCIYLTSHFPLPSSSVDQRKKVACGTVAVPLRRGDTGRGAGQPRVHREFCAQLPAHSLQHSRRCSPGAELAAAQRPLWLPFGDTYQGGYWAVHRCHAETVVVHEEERTIQTRECGTGPSLPRGVG